MLYMRFLELIHLTVPFDKHLPSLSTLSPPPRGLSIQNNPTSHHCYAVFLTSFFPELLETEPQSHLTPNALYLF